MTARTPAVFVLVALLAACGEPVSDDHFANSSRDTVVQPAAEGDAAAAWPVRVGEYGLNFDACPWIGTTRRVEPSAGLPVRASPFDSGEQTAQLPAGARFYVCSRSHDQKWFGIVFEQGGGLAPRCGVADPVGSKRAYDGPCRSGWVSSAFVKLIAGNDQPDPNRLPQPIAEGAPAP